MDLQLITDILQWTMLISAIVTIILILLQSRGASLGAGSGGSGELFTERRGLEKNLYDTTIVTAIIFVLSLVVGLIIG